MNREEMYTELNTLKYRIAELEAQMNEPEWVPFPGELIEVRNVGGPEDGWKIRRFVSKGGSVAPFVCEGEGNNYRWMNARPLSDPNIIQLRPHTPGDPMPCDGKSMVVVRIPDGRISSGKAYSWAWDGIVAWAPLP